MLNEITSALERLNLSYHMSLAGKHFPEIVALLSIVFGGAFLLYGWRHHEYFLGITGFLVGGWAGMLAKAHFAPMGQAPPILYLGLCAVGGAFVASYFKRFVGVLLGGFTVAILGSVFFPNLFRPGNYSTVSIALAFLLGGGLGAIFPKFFFIFNSSLIGSVFATYGISFAVLSQIVGEPSPRTRLLIHVLVFLPLLVFGILFQLVTSKNQPLDETSPAPAPPPPHPARNSA